MLIFYCLIGLAFGTHVNHFPAVFNEQENAAVPALRQLISAFYASNTDVYTINAHGSTACTRRYITDFLNQFLFEFELLKVTLDYGRAANQLKRSNSRKYNLVVVDGAHALKYIHPAALTHDYDINEHYLVYLLEATTCNVNTSTPKSVIEARKILQYFWRHHILNVSLLRVQKHVAIELFTLFPFSDAQHCQNAHVQRINQFIAGHWLYPGLERVFPSKLHDLRACPLRVVTWETPPYLSIHPNLTGTHQVGDFEGVLLLELANKLNFTISLMVPPHDEQRGKRLANGTTTGAMKMLQQGEADLSLGCFRLTSERAHVLTGALPYYQTWQSYGVLLTAQPYTSLEILTFAFDKVTWLCLGICLHAVALFTCMLYRYHQQQYLGTMVPLILGQPSTRHPLLDIVASFLGYPLLRLPVRTFSRYTFLLWIFFGFTLRVAYQSLLFKLLQTNLYRKPPQTLDQLIAQHYTLAMTANTYDSVYTVPHFAAGHLDLVIIQNSSEMSTYALLESSMGMLLAGVAPLDYLTYYAIRQNRRGVFYVLPEKIFTQHITMFFPKHSFLIERFNGIFMNLRSQGMIDFWARQSLDTSYLRAEITEDFKDRGINLERISGVFYLHLLLLIIASCVFGLERLWHRYKRQIRRRFHLAAL